MTEPLPSRIPLRGRRLPSSAADFFRCLGTIENELRRLPQNLCVLLTQTPLTQEGSRYSLFEGKGHRRGRHWKSEGDLPHYPLVGQPPESFPFGTDRFPFGVVLSRTSSLLELAVDAEDRTWLNFGGKCGFYVAGDTVRDSLPEGQVAHELTERTIWHYFDEKAPIPEEALFESVNEQLLHCYHGIRETCMEFIDQLSLRDETAAIIEELEWPEVMLYLALKRPGPFFSVERGSVERSLPGEPRETLIPWGNSEECHHVFRIRPASVAQATSYALEALSRMVHAVDEPTGTKPQAPSGQKTPKSITKEEAEAVARRLDGKDATFRHLTAKEMAARIQQDSGKPCSDSLVKGLPYWDEAMTATGRGRKRGGTAKGQGRKRGTAARPMSFSKDLEAVTGEGQDHEVLEALAEAEEQAKAEQALREQKQAIHLVERSRLSPEEKRQTIARLEDGEMTPQEANQVVSMCQQDSTRNRKKTLSRD